MEKIWKFKTARFTVTCECEEESSPDLSWADEDTLFKLACGTYSCVEFSARVYLDGRLIGAAYLGNSVYEDVGDFPREHVGLAVKSRKDGKNYGCYFPEMVREAIVMARATIANAPKVRVA